MPLDQVRLFVELFTSEVQPSLFKVLRAESEEELDTGKEGATKGLKVWLLYRFSIAYFENCVFSNYHARRSTEGIFRCFGNPDNSFSYAEKFQCRHHIYHVTVCLCTLTPHKNFIPLHHQAWLC